MDGENSKHENKEKSANIFETKIVKTKDKQPIYELSTIEKKLSPSEILHLHGTTEVEEGEEADLKEHYAHCKKDPGHEQFIPINDFTMEHLPEGYQDTDLYDLIKATAKLTVRVSVQKISPHRPEFWPDTNVPYPYYDKRGNLSNRTGSGEMEVHEFIEGQGYNLFGERNNIVTGENYESEHKTCPCDKCFDSDKPNNIWWEILVHTATHVVFDEIEASHTSCRLFYDSDDSPVVTIDKFSLKMLEIERDECEMKYVTCGDLGKQLYEMRVHWGDLMPKVEIKYLNISDVIYIVSHPHGCSKQVSIGRLKDNHKVREINDLWDMTKLTYTTATCPGSSGATVNLVGSPAADHVHSGSLDSRLNYSCASLFYRQTLKAKKFTVIFSDCQFDFQCVC